MSDIKAMIESAGHKVSFLQYRGKVLNDDNQTLAEIGVDFEVDHERPWQTTALPFMLCVRGRSRAQQR